MRHFTGFLFPLPLGEGQGEGAKRLFPLPLGEGQGEGAKRRKRRKYVGGVFRYAR